VSAAEATAATKVTATAEAGRGHLRRCPILLRCQLRLGLLLGRRVRLFLFLRPHNRCGTEES